MGIYRVGLDVGSTTIKCVVLNEQDKMVYKSYERHRARVREKATELLAHINDTIVKGDPVRISVTGSSGLGYLRKTIFHLCRRYTLPSWR